MVGPVDSRKLRLLLVGGGHAHLEILRRLAKEPQHRLEVTLISWFPKHHYSGMVPGFLNGTYEEDDISFPLGELAGACGGRFVAGKVEAVKSAEGKVRLADGSTVTYDLVSFNIGSETAGADQPGVLENTHQVKPMSRAVLLLKEIRKLTKEPPAGRCFLNVVGGGTAGFEIACALADVARRGGLAAEVALIEGNDEILGEHTHGVRELAVNILLQHRVLVLVGRRVVGARKDEIEFCDAERRRSHLTVWLTGPAAPGIFRDSGLALSERGFLLVDDALRCVSDPNVFGVGDCATQNNYPWTPKAGVYSVRQAPILWKSLLSVLEGSRPPAFVPQKKFLSIMNTSDGKALLCYRNLSSYSRWAWLLKNLIDRRFVARYQSLTTR